MECGYVYVRRGGGEEVILVHQDNLNNDAVQVIAPNSQSSKQ